MSFELIKSVLAILPKAIQLCFSCRNRKEVLMRDLMKEYYLAAIIQLIRKIHAECSRLDATTSREELLSLANIIVNELSPTAAWADGYNREAVIKEFGIEMRKKIDQLLDACMSIDCHTAPDATIPVSKNQILPKCVEVNMIWDEIVDIYIEKVCFFGRVGKTSQKNILESRIEQAVPRPNPYLYLR